MWHRMDTEGNRDDGLAGRLGGGLAGHREETLPGQIGAWIGPAWNRLAGHLVQFPGGSRGPAGCCGWPPEVRGARSRPLEPGARLVLLVGVRHSWYDLVGCFFNVRTRFGSCRA